MSQAASFDIRALELRDAQLIAQTFMDAHPDCFRILKLDTVTLMIQGFILQRVLTTLEKRPLGRDDGETLSRLVEDVLDAAQIINQTCRVCHGRERDHEGSNHAFESAALGPLLPAEVLKPVSST